MPPIIDASLLGVGLYHAAGRTGVSRVVEALVRGLVERSVPIKLAAPTHLAETLRWAERSGLNVTFAHAPADLRRAERENALLRPFMPESVPTKALRRLTYRLKPKTVQLPVETWPAGTIYHSPFGAIPPEVAAAEHVTPVLTVHDLLPLRYPEWFPLGDDALRSALATLPRRARLLSVSNATKADIATLLGRDDVTVIHPAASPDLFYPETNVARQQAVLQRYGLADRPYLLSVATLEPRKNLAYLLRCFATLVESQAVADTVALALVGPRGWKFESILDAAQQQALAGRVVMTGYVPDADLAALYSGARAFVYPSLAEGFGLPPLEAMQCGAPVVASDIPALREVVADAGILVSPDNADALGRALRDVLESETLRSDLHQRGLARAATFSWNRFIEEHLLFYNSIARR